jgi:TldD protein
MNDFIDIASAQMLTPAGLGVNDLGAVLNRLMGPSIDAADLYFQTSRHESWVLEDGIIKEGSFSRDQGVGVRAISGEKTGFAYSDQIILPALEEAAVNARAIAKSHVDGSVKVFEKQTSIQRLYPPESPLDSLSETEKIDLLRQVDAEAI